MHFLKHVKWKRWRVLSFMIWVGQHERGLLITATLLATGIWIFAELADDVIEGKTGSFDRTVLLALRNPDDLADPIGPQWVEELGRDMSAFGGVGAIFLLSAAAVGFLLLQGRYRTAVFLMVAVGGGFFLSLGLKMAFDRPRPDLVPHGSYVRMTSFPSGHSMNSAVAYLTLGALMARVQPKRRLKAYLLLMAFAATGLVGVSRVYLGVHWPTDVLSGWTAGCLWALICWETARRLQFRGRREQSNETTDTAPG
ncbi:MAG: phosphatase PAP2 family protein [Verrucomicrobiia bacterium]